ncbi:hypothetical protein AAFC00_007201 [Neodothiora populina]|uniref:Spo7-like protein n=1 Tax=Neodothiora populina TaxID=2781224 RepID=A0ABR3PHH2_9PEZI
MSVNRPASQIDRIVKGAPPPNVSADQVAQSARRYSSASASSTTSSIPPHSVALPAPTSVHDPLSNLPSSPECIYQNLLILEASLRAQYLSLRARLRLYLVLMTALAAWLITFTYLLFLRPREDGKGAGGSPYWVVDMAERLGWVGGVVTAGLVWGTGMWDRGVRWPRRWVAITNRGLRGFNLKLVIIRKSWWHELFAYLLFNDLLSGKVRGMNFELVPKDIERSHANNEKDLSRLWERSRRELWVEEDIAPGGDAVKLLLLPKPFSPDFREDWDTHRATYWEKENERRAHLRSIVKQRKRQLARQEGGLLWWTGWRGWQKTFHSTSPPDLEKPAAPHSSHGRKHRRESIYRENSGSQPNSRSSTPDPRKKMRKGTITLPPL